MGYHSCKENHRQIVAGHSPYSRRGHIENENEAWLGKPDRKSFFTIRRVMMDREWTTNILLLPRITMALIDYFLQLTVSIMFIYLDEVPARAPVWRYLHLSNRKSIPLHISKTESLQKHRIGRAHV